MRIYVKEEQDDFIKDGPGPLGLAIRKANADLAAEMPSLYRRSDEKLKVFKLRWDSVALQQFIDVPYVDDPTDLRAKRPPQELLGFGFKLTCLFKVAGAQEERKPGMYLSEHGVAQVRGVQAPNHSQEWYVEAKTYQELVLLIWELRAGKVQPSHTFAPVVLDSAESRLPTVPGHLSPQECIRMLHMCIHTAEAYRVTCLRPGPDEEVAVSVREERVRAFAIEQLTLAQKLCVLWEGDIPSETPWEPCCELKESRDSHATTISKFEGRLHEVYPLGAKLELTLRLALVDLNEWIAGERPDQSAESVLGYYLHILEHVTEEGLNI